MSKIIGIGGIFLNFKGDELEVMKWYAKLFDIKVSEYGASFIDGEQLLLLSFKRLKETSPYINFRVDNIEEAVSDVVENGGSIHVKVEEYPYGKFAQVIDPFGNTIELWEANVEYYKKMVKGEVEVS